MALSKNYQHRQQIALQGDVLLNQRQVSGANAAQALTLAATPRARNTLRKIVLDGSAAGSSTVTVSVNAVVVLDLGVVVLATEAKVFDLGPLTGDENQDIVVNVGPAGVGVTTTLSVVADRT